VAEGFRKGELVVVPPMGNGWKLIKSLNGSVLVPEVSDSIKLSVTSLGRTEQVQERLIRGSGKYRVAERGKSSHFGWSGL